MLNKKTTPWGIFLFLLGLAEAFAYYAGGLFVTGDVTFFNYEEKLYDILTHPFRNYWNEMSVACMITAFIIWLMAVSYFQIYYRDYHFGIEQGTARWADIRKLSKKLKSTDENKNTYLTKNIAVGFDALSNMNMLIIGGSGSYKSTSIVTPNILKANCTNVILDIKGDLLKKYGNYLKSKGVTVKSFNLKNPLESDRYNPFRYINDSSDLVSLITNMQASVKPPDAFKGDPFWDDGVALYLQAMFFYEWLEAKEQKRIATMNNILKLTNWETIKIDEDGTTKLQGAMDDLAKLYGDDYPPVRDYRKLKEGASETVRSIIIMVNAQLKLFELPEIKRIFEDDDIDIPSLGLGVGGNPNRKTALFLVLRSRDATYNLFINIFYTQMFRVLCDIADNDCPDGALPVHVRLWADEYYAGPKPADSEVLLGEIRSRNISMIPVLQDQAQIKTLFPNDKWEIFNGNCAAMVYLGSGPAAHSTHQWISDMLNKTTIDTRTEHISPGMHGNNSLQTSKGGVSLMTPDQVREMGKEDCILFIEHENPIYDQKNLPWKTGNKEWQEAEKLKGSGYVHPVRTVYNEKKRSYKTILSDSKIQFLQPEDLSFYKEAAKTDGSIKVFNIDETDFLYLNWNVTPKPTEEEIGLAFKECMLHQRDVSNMEKPEDVIQNREQEKKQEKEDGWDLSGTITECLKKYAYLLSAEEQNEIVLGLEAGLSARQIKKYFSLRDVKKMEQYRRAFAFANGAELN